MIHRSRQMQFDDLHRELTEAVHDGWVSVRSYGSLCLYCYTRKTTYERHWTPITTLARGLIIDIEARRVIATSWEKFFNVGESEDTIPDLPFQTYEKVDGSLIIIFWHDGQWRTATKGSFDSDQARWAAQVIEEADDTGYLVPGTTYLAEAVYPENRIVVHYDYENLVLLGGYDRDGYELSRSDLWLPAACMGWRLAERYHYTSISDLLIKAKDLPVSEEGFVIRFSNGHRLKVKGDEYRRVHALISRCTPLAMWEAMRAGDDMGALRKDLPEEFWADFDGIVAELNERIADIINETENLLLSLGPMTDKEIGLQLASFPASVRPFIFPYRKNGGDLLFGRARECLFRAIRPTGNVLPGYTPSYAMNRVVEEMV